MGIISTGPDAPWVVRARGARNGSGLDWLKILTSPITGGVLGAAGTIAQNLWTASRADSAHQREVRDLQAAGIHPMMSARGGGLDVGPMVNPAEGVSSALSIQRQKAEIELIRAQAHAAASSGELNRTQAAEIATFSPGRGALVAAQEAIASQNLAQQREMFPVLVEKARGEVASLKTSAAREQAQALLLKAQEAVTSRDAALAQDWLKLYRQLGSAGPYLRVLALTLESLSRGRR